MQPAAGLSCTGRSPSPWRLWRRGWRRFGCAHDPYDPNNSTLGGNPGTAGLGGDDRTPTHPDTAPPDPSTLCIQTADRGCLSLAEYEHEVDHGTTVYTNQRNFKNQWGLSRIQAQRAYAHVELLMGTPIDPGEGETLGFVDSGIDTSHQLFAGATINETFLLGATNETGTRFSHGTPVAGVAAAPRIVTTVNAGHGVAWGADIAMFAIPVGRGPVGYNPISLTALQAQDSRWTTIINDALNWRSGSRSVPLSGLSWRILRTRLPGHPWARGCSPSCPLPPVAELP